MSDDRFAADLAYEHDLTLAQGRMLAELAIHALDPSFAPWSPGHLADAAVADAFLSGPLGRHADDDSVERLERLLEQALDDGYDTAGAHYALAAVAEHRGDLPSQRSHLGASLVRDADFAPARLALGFLAFVAGDAGRAGAHLCGVDDNRAARMRHTLSHVPPLGTAAGRNDPCPCGSGRKVKRCCPSEVRQSLAWRADWLWEKAEQWLRRRPQVGAQVDLACELAGVDHHLEEPDAVLDVLEGATFRSIALLDAGLLQGFLDRYGSLLPEDERALAKQWLGVRQTVWRVEETEPGWWLRMTDLASGAEVQAANGSVSRCTVPGEVLFGAVVPAGDGWLLPEHPLCLVPDDGEALAELVRAGIEPLAVAATVIRGRQNATM